MLRFWLNIKGNNEYFIHKLRILISIITYLLNQDMNNDSELQRISDYLNVALASHQGAASILPTDSSNVLEKLSDGLLLCFLVNTLSKKGPVIDEASLKTQRPTIFHKLDHSNKAIEGAKNIGLEIVNVRAESIVEMKETAVLGLMNQIMRQCPR